MNLAEQTLKTCAAAKEASIGMARSTSEERSAFLHDLADRIGYREQDILAANRIDMEKARAGGMDEARLDRLRMSGASCASLAAACDNVAEMPDPIGVTERQWQRPNGILVGKMRIPLGVICMIYEARPGVTIDAAILALKAGNAIILRGGREASESNRLLASLIRGSLAAAHLPALAAQLIETPDRAVIPLLCKMDDYIDLLIPRGGEQLIRLVAREATVPVLMHYKGVCHCYIDKGANLEQSLAIVENSKIQRPGVCNALECLLVHRDEAARFLPMLAQRLAPCHLEFRADAGALPLLGPNAAPLQPEDVGREFLARILAVVLVADMEEAIEYIGKHGSRHTDVICTNNYDHAMRFLREVDSSMVGVNVSTRFNDGGELGLGAEIGISTTKLHAFGPMGIKELTATKFVVLGNGQIRK